MANIMRIGGGGGGERPELIVTAPTGSTVICTKGTKTVTSPEVSGTWLFKLPEFGAWTVTATKGANSASDTVDVQQDYSAILSYKPTASLAPISVATYTDGISALTADKMSLYGEAISNNADIGDTTSVIYIDDGASHYKVSVGDSINLTVSGASYEFVVIGFNHDDLTDATAYGSATATGKAGFTLQMRNCLATKNKMNGTATNANGWNGCDFRATLQSTIKVTMDSVWQTAIKAVEKLTTAGSLSTSIVTSNDTLFLPSEIEIYGSAPNSFSGEGHQYAWYRAGNTTVKKVGTSASEWWERSPRKQATNGFCCGNVDGTGSAASANAAYGISIALCI